MVFTCSSMSIKGLLALRYNYKYGIIGLWRSDSELEDIPTAPIDDESAKTLVLAGQQKEGGTTLSKSLSKASAAAVSDKAGGPGKLYPIIQRILMNFGKLIFINFFLLMFLFFTEKILKAK